MPRIHQLDTDVINKIAAGEVIERPASVVKELLENSLDALATRVEVDVAQGGAELIRVVDDGEGIHPDDLALAVSSHATSKIQASEDLFRVQTLGFRGEALASIAAVSRFRIRSRQANADSGFELEPRSGQVSAPQPCGCPVGTLVEIRQLFANTPVRRKFLKTTATEFAHISEQFTRIALAHPRLHAVLRHNGKLVYELPATNQLSERLELFYGSQLAETLIWVESETDNVRLWGYVAHPSQSKSTRKGQYLFLNGRWIQDRSLQHALSEAYRGLLMVGRHPIAFLFLDMPPHLVDVNVHPTKSEVRFLDTQQPYRQLLSTLRTEFLGMELDSAMRVPSDSNASPANPPANPQQQRELQIEIATWAKDQLSQWKPTEIIGGDPAAHAREEAERTSSDNDRVGPDGNPSSENAPGLPTADAGPEDAFHTGVSSLASVESGRRDGDAAVPSHDDRSAASARSPVKRVMQIHDCYLVVETDDGLTVIDQHALHERVMYEQLRQRVLSGAVETQKMLVPETIEMSSDEATALLEHRDLLRELGFHVEEFGKNTILLTGYPPMLARTDFVQLVRDVAEQLIGTGQKPTRRDILDQLLHMMSCKAAIKAGQRLTSEEMESLLAQRHLIDNAHHCPHGRPTALTLSRTELDRQFGRLG
jgi:DNA mismatch repair protein MutL